MGPDDWSRIIYSDGTIQYRYAPRGPLGNIYIERVDGPWFIVSRRPPDVYADVKYAPVVAGPFKTLRQAKTVFVVMDTTGQLDSDIV